MKKKFVSVLCAAACAGMALCACSPEKEENVFTGETANEPAYQANLDAITPSAYRDVEGLDLEPGTYISVVGKEENSSYWKQIRAGVEQAAADLNEALGYSGGDQIKVLYNAPADGENIDEQVNILDEELARYPDVIAIGQASIRTLPAYSSILRLKTGSRSLRLIREMSTRRSSVPAERTIHRRRRQARPSCAKLSETAERSR